MRHIKPVAVVLLALSLGWVGGLSQTSSQTVTITVNQSLYLDCSPPANLSLTPSIRAISKGLSRSLSAHGVAM
jgi:hypothetical protein